MVNREKNIADIKKATTPFCAVPSCAHKSDVFERGIWRRATRRSDELEILGPFNLFVFILPKNLSGDLIIVLNTYRGNRNLKSEAKV